ncbi:MAG: SusC/RagA family TonB-linked outer membrane protein [Weeksellaceae bacterium]
MRLYCIIFFLLGVYYLNGQVQDTSVNINYENTDLETLMSDVANQVNLNIIFDDESLKNIAVDSFVEQGITLDELFSQLNILYGISTKIEDNTIFVYGFGETIDPINLSGVIAIGYGDKGKHKITTAVSEIDTKFLENRSLSNATSALQGTTPGLNISNISGQEDENPRINIRGFTSINGGSPLVLIDGIEGNLNAINPNDIESISVLKDAGAAAIYGARGAFGVVLVKTKTAKKNKISVQFNSSYSLIYPTNNTDYLKDPYEAVKIVDESFKSAVGRIYTGYTEEDYEELKKVSENPSLARIVVSNRKGRDQYVHYGYTDWYHYFFNKQRPTFLNEVSISGGSDKLKIYLSYRNFTADGFLKVQDDYYKKDNFRTKVNLDLNDWISISNNSQYYNSFNLMHGGSQYGFRDTWSSVMRVHALPSYFPINPDGGALWRTELNNYTIGDGVYASLLHGKSKEEIERDEFSTISEMVIKPIKDFSLTANYAYRKNTFDRIRRSTKIPYSIYVGETGVFGENKLASYISNDRYNALNIFGDYSKKIGQHSVSATLGFNQESYYYEHIEADKMDLISDDLNSLGLGSSNPETNGSAHEWALRGYFFRLSYDYDDKYLLEVNGRYDATSRFPKEHRWGLFPSISLGWNLANENFFKDNIPSISQLKIRGSYGSLGNQNVAAYAYIPTMNKSTDNNYAIDGILLDYITAPGLNPRDITWEEVRTKNFGADVALFKNKVSLNLDIFTRDILGMLTEGKTLPSVIGTAAPKENSADLETEGFEVGFNFNNKFILLNSEFNYSFFASLSDSKTHITNFDNPNNSLTNYYVGMELGEIWGYTSDGLFQTMEEINNHADQRKVSNLIYSRGGLRPGDIKFNDLNGDGEISNGAYTLQDPGDLRIIGNAAPRYNYSFRVAGDWKGFDISAFFQGVGKQDWYPATDERLFWGPYNRPYNNFIRKDLVNNYWTPENTKAYFPRLVGYTSLGGNRQLGVANSRYLQDISYLRLKNIVLGYTIPKRIYEKFNINEFRIYLTGENLFTWTSLTDYVDPESASKSIDFNRAWTADSRGTTDNYPISKSISLGLQLKF